MSLKIQSIIDNFEKKTQSDKDKSKNSGIVYTPAKLVIQMVENLFRVYFKNEFAQLGLSYQKFFKEGKKYESLHQIVNIKPQVFEQLKESICSLKILDPSCGTGRFLVSTANELLRIQKILNPNQSVLDIKRRIIQDNIHGIEIEAKALLITKLRLLNWYLIESPIRNKIEIDSDTSLNDIDILFNKLDLKFNLFNLDFLFDYEQCYSFDFIIGNPPYIENKKIRNIDYKRKLYKKYATAYKLFDISIIFIDKSLSLLKNNEGLLSFIVPNKFLSADYGIKIRKLLIESVKLEEFINISHLPIFNNKAAYPIIITCRKGPHGSDNIISIKNYSKLEDYIDTKDAKVNLLSQALIKKLPGNVIPLSGNIPLVEFLFNNFQEITEVIKDLKVIYRPFGFLKWAKHFDNISEIPKSKNDKIIIGTGNIDKYHYKFDKRIKIAKKDLKVSYYNYRPGFEEIWRDFDAEKLIFREIAKELTWVYDPGLFTNITGLYFLKIPSFNTDALFSLLAIMNSAFMDTIFKTLFGTLHLAGGYLRFNGSFIKRLPIPNIFPKSLSNLAKILQFMSQLRYTCINSTPRIIKLDSLTEIDDFLRFFNRLTNSLVTLLYLLEGHYNINLKYDLLKDLLFTNDYFPNIQYRFILNRFILPKFEAVPTSELFLELKRIRNNYYDLIRKKRLLNQIVNINQTNINF
ncbi:MAG: Eco57I restriction-modification methylase domain-containing protein [Candidatus Hodarchaeota archaeon]